jgi:ribonuclease G
MQITRQRHAQTLARDMRRPCPYCGGRGTLESAQTTALRVLEALTAQLKKLPQRTNGELHSLRITVHPEVMEFLRKFANGHLSEIESSHGVRLIFSAAGSIHRENFTIAAPASDETR